MANKQRGIAKPQQKTPARQPAAPETSAAQSTPSSRAEMEFSIQSEHYSGHIPPHVIAQYDRSEAGRQFIALMVKQAEHRMHLEKP
jgi:hypothetical protein